MQEGTHCGMNVEEDVWGLEWPGSVSGEVWPGELKLHMLEDSHCWLFLSLLYSTVFFSTSAWWCYSARVKMSAVKVKNDLSAPEGDSELTY